MVSPISPSSFRLGVEPHIGSWLCRPSGSPNGIDLYFDNVGGDHLEGAIDTMNVLGRIVCCGMISSYNAKGPTPGPQNIAMVIGKWLRIQGFIVVVTWTRSPLFSAT